MREIQVDWLRDLREISIEFASGLPGNEHSLHTVIARASPVWVWNYDLPHPSIFVTGERISFRTWKNWQGTATIALDFKREAEGDRTQQDMEISVMLPKMTGEKSPYYQMWAICPAVKFLGIEVLIHKGERV